MKKPEAPYKLEPTPCRTCPTLTTVKNCQEMLDHECTKYEAWLRGRLKEDTVD